MGYERKRILLGLCKILNVIGIDIEKIVSSPKTASRKKGAKSQIQDQHIHGQWADGFLHSSLFQ